MIVHFISGKTNIGKNIDYLRRIQNTIHRSGHMLARDWIEPAFIEATEGIKGVVDWNAVFKENMESLNKADVMVAEVTEKSFGVGFQVALAAQQKKPILLLHQKHGYKKSLADGVAGDYIERKDYQNGDEIEGLVNAFLEKNDIKAKDMRFNFFIDRNIYNYLRWAAAKSGKTKAEILRELVLDEIEKSER
jgi:hypothetical protein